MTLSIEPAIIEKAKRMAEANNTTVSAMFTQFIEFATAERERRSKIGPLTQKLSGIIDLPPGKNHKKLVEEALARKYRVAR